MVILFLPANKSLTFEISETGQFREPGGGVCNVKNFDLVIRDVNWKPLQPTEARRQLNNAVLHNYDEKTVPLTIGARIPF